MRRHSTLLLNSSENAAMKIWIFLTLAIATLVFDGAAFAQTQPPAKPVGETLAAMQQKFAGDCKTDRQALAGAKPGEAARANAQADMDCECLPKASEAAFPPEMRSTQMAAAPFLARLNGANDICIARFVRTAMTADCAKGADPLAQRGNPSTPAVAAARCACLSSELAKTADADFADSANMAASRFDAALKASAGQPAPEAPRAGSFMPAVAQTCRGAGTAAK